jgi:AcrR family transcriptional regulator
VPRKYRMGKRAEEVARTRERIVEAAMSLYLEQPVAMTSMADVARRADVAPGTVLNHFATQDDLAEVVVEALVLRLEAPSREIFDGHDDVAARVTALAWSLAGFFERAEPWFGVHEREHRQVRAFEEGARRFDERVDALIREAIGGKAGERAILVVRTLMSAPVFRSLRRYGALSSSAAADLVSEIVLSWLDASTREDLNDAERGE